MDIENLQKLTKNLSVLYVEDNINEAVELFETLKDLFYRVYTKKNGLEGLELYKKYHNKMGRFVDIVITDLKMPKMDGHKLIHEIKSINPKQHIIVISAYNDSENLINLLQNGVDDFIMKPLLSKSFNKTLEKCTKKVIQDKEFASQQILLNEIATLQNNMLVVLDEEQNIIFSNQNFLDFFNISSKEEFYNKYKRLAYQFLDGDEFFSPNGIGDMKWLDQIKNLEDHKRVVSIIDVNTISPKAFTDELTGIYNRAYFNEIASNEIAKYLRDQKVFSVILFDIDYFKKINDTYGHQIGDDILKELAYIIETKTRQSDVFARWGGEEFIKILPSTSFKAALNVAEHLRETIEKHKFPNDIKLTCSFGVSEISKDDSIEDVIKRADEALYISKNNGRNRVEGIQ